MITERAKFFREHGWLKIDTFFTPEEVNQVRGELLKLAEQGIAARNDFQAQTRKLSDQKSQFKTQFAAEVCNSARFNAVLRNFATSEKIGALMREILDVPRIRLFRDICLIKGSANENDGTGLHQDEVFYPLDRKGVAALWIALTDLPANSGTMRFIDGSHKWGSLGRQIVPLKQWLTEHPEHADIITPAPAMNSGGVTIHDGYMLHGSDASTWDQPRLAYALTYFRADALFNGMPSRYTNDVVGLKQDEPFDHEAFPLVS